MQTLKSLKNMILAKPQLGVMLVGIAVAADVEHSVTVKLGHS